MQEIYYAISASNTWDPTYVYDCPAGYHWASTDEALQWVLPPASNPNAQVNDFAQNLHAGAANPIHSPDTDTLTSYYDQCGWKGYMHNAKKRVKFRFSDSHVIGSYKSAGAYSKILTSLEME